MTTGPQRNVSRATSASFPCLADLPGKRDLWAAVTECVWAGGKLLCVLSSILCSTVGKGPESVAGSRGASVWGT